jgi:hypothetical protein
VHRDIITDQDRATLSEAKIRVARELARKHYDVEAGLVRIFRLSGPDDAELTPAEPIKLLEVIEGTFPSGARPLQFGPAPASGIPFPSVIVEVTPEEFVKIQSQELKLPRGWRLAEELPRPVEEPGAA